MCTKFTLLARFAQKEIGDTVKFFDKHIKRVYPHIQWGYRYEKHIFLFFWWYFSKIVIFEIKSLG